jgi:hypothetical protein
MISLRMKKRVLAERPGEPSGVAGPKDVTAHQKAARGHSRQAATRSFLPNPARLWVSR